MYIYVDMYIGWFNHSGQETYFYQTLPGIN